jgi:colanic acid biosynthesis glycosyl transferase WcaI
MGGVSVHRCPIWIPRQPRGIGRIVYALSFALSSLPVMLRKGWRGTDLVIVIEPSFLNLPVALLAARIARSKAWLHIQDFEIDLAYDMGQLGHGRKFAEKIEAWVMKRFDAVSSISRRMLARACAKGVTAESIVLLPNSVNLSEVRPVENVSAMRRELNIPEDRTVALFSGSLGAKQGIDAIIEAARILKDDPNLLFVVCGEGVSAEKLRAQANGLENVRFLPLQPLDRLNDLLNLADLHLLPQQLAAADSVFPSKLIGMLASGRPIIAACRPGSEIADSISGCGLVTPPGDAEALAAAIVDLAHDDEARIQMGLRSREYAVREFCQDSILQRFEREMLDRTHCGGRSVKTGLSARTFLE